MGDVAAEPIDEGAVNFFLNFFNNFFYFKKIIIAVS